MTHTQATDTREGIVPWSPEYFGQHDPDGAAGMCHFAPNCGGGIEYGKPDKETGERKRTRPDHDTCPSAPAEFAARTGMLREEAGFERYVPLCRARAVRQYGDVAVRTAEQGG